jgi:hypothetical protein
MGFSPGSLLFENEELLCNSLRASVASIAERFLFDRIFLSNKKPLAFIQGKRFAYHDLYALILIIEPLLK